MARPKYSENDNHALSKIEDAFWSCLSENPYSKVTVVSVAKKAGLNHNTIYYYFKNINDIVSYCFQNVAKVVLRKEVFFQIYDSSFIVNASDIDSLTAEGWKKISLFAISESNYLLDIFYQSLKNYWLRAMNLNYSDLEIEEKMEIEYAVYGLIGVVISSKREGGINVISFLRKTGKSKDMFELTKRLSKKYSSLDK